jgi:hypothetical protein
VALTRPWWSALLINAPRWYVPGYAAGAIVPGPADDSAMAIVTGMLLVRDVRISGRWSDHDRGAMGGAASFGPFSLLDRTIENETLQIDGVQILGWTCERLPALPPAGGEAASAA